MSEPTYTLAEAQVLLAQQACQASGHDITCHDINPTTVECGRCAQQWTLTPVSQ